MKGFASHGLALAVGVALGVWVIPSPSVVERVPAQVPTSLGATLSAAPAAQRVAAPAQQALNQGPEQAQQLAQQPRPEQRLAEQLTLADLDKLQAAVLDNELPTFADYYRQAGEDRTYDDHAIKAEQAVWDGIAKVQQELNVTLQEVRCDSNRLCVAVVNAEKAGHGLLVGEGIRAAFRESGVRLPFFTQETQYQEGEDPLLQFAFLDKSPFEQMLNASPAAN